MDKKHRWRNVKPINIIQFCILTDKGLTDAEISEITGFESETIKQYTLAYWKQKMSLKEVLND